MKEELTLADLVGLLRSYARERRVTVEVEGEELPVTGLHAAEGPPRIVMEVEMDA